MGTASPAESILEDRPWTEGQIIHEILSGTASETVLRSRGLPLDPDRMARYRIIYDTFWSSSFVSESSHVLTEFPFLLNLDGFRIRGSIDLLLHTPQGWGVVDYKTGKPGHADDYAIQLAVYKMAAEAITGEKVKVYLYFTENSEFVELDPDMDAIRTEICSACSRILERENV
jgi:CRISPR/Cas system-associated exonuclease Cas4 (RecB family)